MSPTPCPCTLPKTQETDGPGLCPERSMAWQLLQLHWMTFLGGSNNDQINGVALDTLENLTVGGATGSPNFPVLNAIQPVIASTALTDAFIARLASSGSALNWSTFWGGGLGDAGFDVAVTHDGNRAFLCGNSGSVSNFPLTAPEQATFAGGPLDGFYSTFGEPDINVSPTAINFGTVTVGSSATTNVVIHNVGTAPLTLTALPGRPVSPGSPFSVAPSLPTTVIVSGALVVIQVTFTPTSSGVGSVGNLSLLSDDIDEPIVTVSLKGRS